MVSAVGSGACAGLAIISLTVLGVDVLRSGSSRGDASFYLLVAGTLTGIVVAGLATWKLLAPVHSTYRRGALSLVCSFATVLLMLVCIPVHQALGRVGLLCLIGISSLAGAILALRSRRVLPT